MQPRNQIIEISFWTMFKAALLVILLWALWVLRDIIAVILISIVIASAIEPANHFFARFRVPRVLSVVLIYLSAFLLFSLIFYLVVPPLFGDILDFVNTLPSYIEQVLGPQSPLFLLVQEHGIENFLRIITPLEHEFYILDLWRRSQRKIGRWLQGQILLGVLVGVIVFLGLTIL